MAKASSSKTVLKRMNYLPVQFDILPMEIINKAEVELGETPERKRDALIELRKKISEENDFHPKIDDIFLLRFLRTKKFDVESSFKLLKNYYTYNTRYSGILTNFLPADKKFVLDKKSLARLPYRTNEYHAIGMGILQNWDLDLISVDDVIATIIIAAEKELDNEANQICGFQIIVDLRGLSLNFVRRVLTPTNIYRIVKGVQDCLPARLKGIHVVNEPFYVHACFTVLKALVTEKIRSRIRFHGQNMKNLHKYIPADILPKELGGNLGPLDPTEWNEEILNSEGNIAKLRNYGYESKRALLIRKRSSLSFGLYA